MRVILFISGLLLIGMTPVLAATGRILDKVEAEQADTAALDAEARLFKSIGMGIALSIAQCEGRDDCNPAVEQPEIQKLLDTINVRIDDLVLRLQEGEEEYTDVLTAYVDQRENYVRYQQQLEDVIGEEIGIAAEEEEIPEDTFADDATAPAQEIEGAEVDFSIFEDADEPLIEAPAPEEELPDE